jgi:hypothetical protein
MSIAKSYRAWINQPSTLQPHHNLHGKRVVVIPSESQFDKTVRVFFADNDDSISMEIFPTCLSDGWPKHL